MTIECPKCQTENPNESKFCNKCATPFPDLKDAVTLETPKQELTTGSTFAGRYQIIEELGKGGMGKVYKVLDKEINTKVALKLILPEIAVDKNTIERFRNELKTARDISHKNVCRMYDLNREKDTYYITMEYVSGGDLKNFIRRAAPLSTSRALSIGKQICKGLSEAHKIGIVHRDLKPNNIMIDDNGSARIMDFGIARSVKGKGITGSGIMIGTPEYMSPEQAEGKDVDFRSDIYSLGVILYEMVTGQLPFHGDTPLSIAMKHKGELPKDPIELNPQIPKDFSRVILKCLEKAKENRFQSADEVLQDIKSIEEGLPTTGRTIPHKKPLTSKEITVTFGLKKTLIPFLIVLASIIVIVLTLKLLPKKKIVVAPIIENSIAVISFENQTGDQTYDYLQKAIPNLLITSLEQTGNFHVTTWERMRDLLKQIGKEDVEIINSDSGFELCQRDGIAAIVLGSYTKAGNVFVTDVKVLDVETKNLLMSSSSRGEGIDSILKTQIDELSNKIIQNIGSSSQKMGEVKTQISGLTSSSMEAYNYFLKGREAFEEYYFNEAVQFLEKAIEYDSTFAMAYYYLAQVYRSISDPRSNEEALEKAKIYSENASDKERLYIEASYALDVEKNPQKQLQFLKEIATKYPGEKRAHYELGKFYQDLNMFNQAIEVFQSALELDPNYGEAMNSLAYTYSNIGDFEAAVEYFKKYVTVSPGNANPIDSLGEVYLRMGKLDEAIVKYKEALEIKPDFPITRLSIGYIYALKENYPEAMKWLDLQINFFQIPWIKSFGYLYKGFYHFWLGNLKQSLLEFQMALDLAKEVRNEMFVALIENLKGSVYYELDELELSQKSFKKWFDYFLEYEPQFEPGNTAFYSFDLGLIDLKQGRIDSAKSRLAKMKSLLPEIDPSNENRAKFSYDILQGEILLAEGSIDQAVAILEKASQLGRPPQIQFILSHNVPFIKDVLARAYQKNGEIEKAIVEYERLVTFDPNTEERYLIHPKYHFRLAKLYEKKGFIDKAIEHYEKFLDLWKDADPGSLDVEDAKKRLTGLKVP